MTGDPPAGPAAPRLAVLVVDDEPFVLEEMACGLARGGTEVLRAGSADAAARVIAGRDDIGVVVTDIRMPGESGLSFAARLLREQPAQAALEVVLVTGHGTMNDAMAAVRTGAFDFIQKPFRMAELRDTVRQAMGRAQARRADAAALAVAQDAMLQGAERDPLTGFATMAVLQRRLAGGGPSMGLVRLDLHRLRAVTERLGRDAGRELILAAAARLQAAAAPGDLLVRLSDHGFAILREPVDEPGLLRLAEALFAAATEPLALLCGVRLVVEVSVGAALGGGPPTPGLLLKADAALAQSRRSLAAELFAPDRHADEMRYAALGQDLLAAIDTGGFELRFQPIVELQGGTLAGFEALLRWTDPRHGVVSPGVFLPLAEELGVITRIDRFVVGAVISQLRAWAGAWPPRAVMNLNVTSASLTSPAYVEALCTDLDRAGIPPGRLCVEVTEGQALQEAAYPQLQALRQAGIRIAVDDFGTGHSSLARLREMPVDVVKLDRSFLAAQGSGEADPGFVARIVDLAHSLSLTVVAEGVETEAQLRLVRAAACDRVQGYLFAPPLTPAAAAAWLDGSAAAGAALLARAAGSLAAGRLAAGAATELAAGER